jgi:hypothetical protein
MNTNPTIQKTMKVVTIAGASILAIRSAMSLMSVKSPKEAVMPIVSILVAVSAFNYAMTSKAGDVTIKA